VVADFILIDALSIQIVALQIKPFTFFWRALLAKK
jgi:hypothetical protein